jgi:ribosomal protein L24
MSAANTFRPGDRVRVIVGDSAGVCGEVVSILDACVLWMNAGPAAPAFSPQPGEVCVAITISGVCVPIALDPSHLELDGPDPTSLVPPP